MGLQRLRTRQRLVRLGGAGGHGAVHGDLRDRLLGVLVLWLLCRLSVNTDDHSERNHNYSHKGPRTDNNPHV